MSAPRVQSPPTLVHHIATTLTDLIQSGADGFRPGTRLHMAKLAQMFGVSPTPIKEALRQLHEHRLIVITPRRGATVVTMSARDFHEVLELREQFELLGLRINSAASNRASRERLGAVLPHLETTLGQMQEAAAAVNRFEYHRFDWRFHALLVQLSGNSRLQRFYEELLAQYRIRPAYVAMSSADMAISLAEHDAIMQALTAGDIPGAERAISAHYQATRARAALFVASHEDERKE